MPITGNDITAAVRKYNKYVGPAAQAAAQAKDIPSQFLLGTVQALLIPGKEKNLAGLRFTITNSNNHKTQTAAAPRQEISGRKYA